MTPIITTMVETDLEELQANLLIDFDDFWSYSIFKNEFENKNSHYIVAKIEDKIVGFGGIWKAVDDVHITNIVTHKNFRNQGIGSLLLEKLIDMAKELKVSSITLEVSANNIPAQNLYKKYHFKPLGIRKNYYKNTDAIIMTLFF